MKRRIAMLTACMLACGALAGCGGNGGADGATGGGEAAGTGGSAAAGTESGSGNEAAGGAGAQAEVPADVADWPVVTTAVVPTQPITDEQMVEDALNEYLVSISAGIQMDIIPIEFGNLSTTLTLMLTSPDDPIDVFSYQFFSSLTGVVSNEQVIPLDGFVEKYPDIVDVVGEEYMKVGQMDGTQYAIPVIGAYGQMMTYALRTDIAEELGVTDKEGQKMTLREVTDMVLLAKEKHPEMIFIPVTWDAFVYGLDHLGDSKMTGVLMDSGLDSTEIVNIYETDEFREFLDYVNEWESAGLLLDDPLNQPLDKSYCKTGVSGGVFANGFDVGAIKSDLTTYGYDWTIFPITDPVATVSSTSAGYCISSVTKDEEASMKALYLMYTDEQVMRFLGQGIEDVHYVVDENSCSWYPEGEGMTTLGWGTGAQWYFPNQTLCIPFQTDNAAYYEEMKATNDGCRKSKAIGFTFDNSTVYNEYTAVTAVIDEYSNALFYGQVDTDTYLAEFLTELDEAGIDAVIEEKQRQLDAFLAK